MPEPRPPSITLLEDRLYVISKPIGMPQYDFNFESHFICSHPVYLEKQVKSVARMGAASDYKERFESLLGWGVELIHSPDEYNRTSYLPNWYPLISEYTPRSIWYETFPTRREIENNFNWPIFIKGERQTAKHDRTKSIIESVDDFDQLSSIWKNDPILHWQRPVIREFVPLRSVGTDKGQPFPKSYEFRTFWWKDACAGIGSYWSSEAYAATQSDTDEILRIGSTVARAIDVTFLVIDLAMTREGQWIVIECNDGQDSGYAGVNPGIMWRKVLDIVNKSSPARLKSSGS